MARGFIPLILLASLLYASTYLFIKVAVEEIPPATLVAVRLLLAAPIFLLLLARVGDVRAAVDAWRPGLVLGVINLALPISLLAVGEKWVDSGVAAIGIASTPIFVQLLARRFHPGERVGGLRLAGIVVGLVGVGLLAGAAPDRSWAQIGGTLAIVASALSFAAGTLYAQTSLARSRTLAIAASSSICGGLVIMPFALAQLPDHVPSWKAIGALLGLTFVNSIASQLLGFSIVVRYGAARNSLSTYLTPPFALILGALVLDESITASALAGLALILVGVSVGAGVLGLRSAARATNPLP